MINTRKNKRANPKLLKLAVLGFKSLRIVGLMVYDSLALALSMYLSLGLRFDEWSPEAMEFPFFYNYINYLPFAIGTTLLLFFLFRLYASLWQFVSIRETVSIGLACFISVLVHYIVTVEIINMRMPRTCYPIYLLIFMLLVALSRFSYRIVRAIKKPSGNHSRSIMVIGAGAAADMLIREINGSSSLAGHRVVCIIDDDTSKTGRYLRGVKIVGTRRRIEQMAKAYGVNEIIFAVPSASVSDRARILNICKNTGCELKTLPGVYQIVQGQVTLNDVRRVEIADLLGREPININVESVIGYVGGKTVLVTGAGGSIGSELCRQIAAHKPARLVLFDIYENNAYDIQNELRASYPELEIYTLIGSVRDTRRINSVMERYRPDIVYHAAAHKHVPLMEDSPNEAIKNNVFGTLKTVQAAGRWGVSRFVLISTDKAVNPTNVMGATKRICEMIIQTYNNRSATDFVAVRFGNVLGSNGSVIPLFKRQIENGGPVSVTHPDIVRYFMTIPEAVSLVLQAGALAKGGEIFVLDMGQPVRILDLAENLIRLSGYTPGVDMEIVFTGLRKGEKLYEELLMNEEGLTDTENKLIHIGHPIEFDEITFLDQLEELRAMMMDDNADIRGAISRLVPTYTPTDNADGGMSGSGRSVGEHYSPTDEELAELTDEESK